MNKIKVILAACLFLIVGQAVFSQSLKVGFGLIDEQRRFASQISLDTLIGYEQTNGSTDYPMPFISYQYPVSEKIQLNIGIQYHVSIIAFAVEYTSDSWPDHIPSIGKGWGTATRNIEIPLGGSYQLIGSEKVKLLLDLSAVPVFAIQDFEKLEVEPQGIDWTQEVIDVLNASETIPKSFYMNFQYGLSLEYKRFGLTLFRTNNINRSISNGYNLYGQDYTYERRTQSTRLGLYYRFEFKKEKE
jgi:hypothetical protein